MRELQHNVVGMLYTIKEMSRAHLTQVEEGRFLAPTKRMEHAEWVLAKVAARAEKALQILKRIGMALKGPEDPVPICAENAGLGESWQAVRALLARELLPGKVTVLTRIPEDFPRVGCAAEDLKEILYHLTKNSLQALSDGGKLILRAQLGYSTREEPVAVIAIADTGPGIREEVLRYLFQPFFTTKPPAEGSGLGLYLTRQLVRRNHGRIAVSSFEGFGTTFTLEFPAASSPALRPADVTSQSV